MNLQIKRFSFRTFTHMEHKDRYSADTNGTSKYSRRQPAVEKNPWEFENPWSHQLCNCTEHCDETCFGIWCYPCFTCSLAWRMQESCWVTMCVPGSLAILRTKMRTAFRIKVRRIVRIDDDSIFVFRVLISRISVQRNFVRVVQYCK